MNGALPSPTRGIGRGRSWTCSPPLAHSQPNYVHRVCICRRCTAAWAPLVPRARADNYSSHRSSHAAVGSRKMEIHGDTIPPSACPWPDCTPRTPAHVHEEKRMSYHSKEKNRCRAGLPLSYLYFFRYHNFHAIRRYSAVKLHLL